MIAGFYVYLHIRADDGLVFYVGKGRGHRARRKGGRSQHWTRTVEKHGLRVQIVALWPTEEEAFRHERRLIAEYRATGAPLCNATDGGEGATGLSAEAKEKIGAAHRGRVLTEEHRVKIGMANAGRTRSLEARKKISAALLKRNRTAETGARISAALTGKTISAEVREKISKTLTGRKPTSQERAKFLAWVNDPVRREKHSAAMKGRPWSEARRAAQGER